MLRLPLRTVWSTRLMAELLAVLVVVTVVQGNLSPSFGTWTDGWYEPRVWLGGAGVTYAQGGRDGQALAL
jgi:hypothetical protein